MPIDPKLLAAALSTGQPKFSSNVARDNHQAFMDISHIREGVANVPDQGMQNNLGNLDRQLFARALVSDNPMQAPGLALIGIPGDYIRKKLGYPGTSDATLESMGAGYKGVAQGLNDWFTK